MSVICHNHFQQIRELKWEAPPCTHEPKSCSFNGFQCCTECFNGPVPKSYNEWRAALDVERDNCPDCQRVRAESTAAAREAHLNRRCGTCGCAPSEDNDVSTHSGVYECSRCWTWRKLDGPAASYWSEKAGQFLSNVDFYDATTYLPKTCGLSNHEMKMMFELVTKVRDASNAAREAQNARVTGQVV